jgi:V8-like Glu-specific endopeptidase
MPRTIALMVFVLTLLPLGASAKDTKFWNLTANTITSLQLSPAGKNDWGRNQADNDRDHTVDHDERLKITDTAPGTYDVKFVDKSGRTCVVPNIEVKTGAVFTIEERTLKDCAK